MSLGKFKQETDDPGANHGVSGGVAGMDAFALPVGGQDDYHTANDGEAVGVPVRVTDTSNPKNGSGGSHKTIDPSKVKGINP